MVDHSKWWEVSRWLEDLDQKAACAYGVRSSLRSLPVIASVERQDFEATVLMLLRCNLCAYLAATWPGTNIPKWLSSSSFLATQMNTSHLNFDSEAHASMMAAYCAAEAAILLPASASNEAANALNHSMDATGDFKQTVAAQDAQILFFTEGEDVFSKALWHDNPQQQNSPIPFQGWESEFLNLMAREPWVFWSEWFQGLRWGEPVAWELQRRVALIDDTVWTSGPEAVATAIDTIQAKFALERRVEELEAELRNATVERHGIGGNMPPEPLDETPIPNELIIIWEPLEDLKNETSKGDPVSTRLQTIINALINALNNGYAWCAKKGDLIVDTAIKWAIPASGTGFFALNPEKLEAVIEAARRLLGVL